jgi:hypothetical protein
MKKSELRQIIRKEIQSLREQEEKNKKTGENAYSKFFRKTAEEFGYDPEEIDNLPEAKKKEFFNYLDANWEADEE